MVGTHRRSATAGLDNVGGEDRRDHRDTGADLGHWGGGGKQRGGEKDDRVQHRGLSKNDYCPRLDVPSLIPLFGKKGEKKSVEQPNNRRAAV